MKRNYKTIVFAGLVIMLPLFPIAQTPPHPNGGGGPGGGNTPVGGGAPIDGGLSILLALGGIYAGKKIWGLRKEEE